MTWRDLLFVFFLTWVFAVGMFAVHKAYEPKPGYYEVNYAIQEI